jgi:hypothetical protein
MFELFGRPVNESVLDTNTEFDAIVIVFVPAAAFIEFTATVMGNPETDGGV